MNKIFGALLIVFLFAFAGVTQIQSLSAYAPQKGDFFKYSETITVNNGQGSYLGYTDQSQITGSEQVNGLNGSIVSSSYTYSYQYSNNQGSTTSNSSSGIFTWASNNFTYVKGTDNQVGYSSPLYVWFAMNTSMPVEGTFYALNTQLTVLAKNYSFQLPTESKYVQTIRTEGTGQYERNDSYGVFNASYIWYVYFDPSTGYIVGYTYLEQDNGQYQGQAGSFTYTDNLYVTSTSYNLALANAPPNGNLSSATSTSSNANMGLAGLVPYLGYFVILLVVAFITVIAIYGATRRRKGKADSLPQHPYPPDIPPPPSSTPWESKIDLGSQPSQQVVIRDVAKVNCKYCGTLIPTTADTCPNCGAPRQ
jgi:hypothetical protein